MPTHAQQTITLLSGPLAPCPVWKPAKGVPPPAPSGPSADVSWSAVSPTLLPACAAALAAGVVDSAWEALSTLAMHFHCHQAKVEAVTGPRPGGAVSWQRPEPRNVGEGDAADGLVAVIARRERRLRELWRLWPDGMGSLPHRASELQRALVSAAPPPWPGVRGPFIGGSVMGLSRLCSRPLGAKASPERGLIYAPLRIGGGSSGRPQLGKPHWWSSGSCR